MKEHYNHSPSYIRKRSPIQKFIIIFSGSFINKSINQSIRKHRELKVNWIHLSEQLLRNTLLVHLKIKCFLTKIIHKLDWLSVQHNCYNSTTDHRS